jgi:prophage maintenance system killer protein
MNTFPYHHPDDRQFSLSFVNNEPSEVVSHLVGLEGNVNAKVEEYTYERDFYAVYKNESGGEPIDNILSDVTFRDQNNKIIVSRILEICQNIIDQNREEEGTPVERYKESEIEKLPSALDRVSWDGNVPEVAGQIASNLIRKHALPNANHRTSISMVQVYLTNIDPYFSMPETTTDTYDWQEWVNEYIEKSKALITVQRKNVLLKHLQEFGVQRIERRNGVVVDLEEYELDMPPGEAKERYAEEHEELWVKFVEEVLTRVGKFDLAQMEGITKKEFAERLKQSE